MININFTDNKDKLSLKLTLKGHANGGEVGKDILCASASILLYTLCQNIIAYHEDGRFKRKPTIKTEIGDGKVYCVCKDDIKYRVVRHAFVVILNGFRLLEANYPEHFKLTIVDKTE